MMNIIAFLLHHANRSCKNKEFYAIKDKLLKMYGVEDGYDVQHIEGKRCYTCNGSGVWHGWYNKDTCNNCAGSGWYKWPQWICLQRYTYGNYRFHRPLKREFSKNNPFTKEELGWDVANDLIKGFSPVLPQEDLEELMQEETWKANHYY